VTKGKYHAGLRKINLIFYKRRHEAGIELFVHSVKRNIKLLFVILFSSILHSSLSS